MLYTESLGGSTDTVACHVSSAQIISCASISSGNKVFDLYTATCKLKESVPRLLYEQSLTHSLDRLTVAPSRLHDHRPYPRRQLQ